MARKIIHFSQEIPAELSEVTKEPIETSDVSGSLNNGAVQVSFIPVGVPKFCGLKSTIGDCLWSNPSNFRILFAKEIYKVFRHVRTPSLTIVLNYKTLGGQLLTVQYRTTAEEMERVAGILATEYESDQMFDMCFEITDRMVLQLMDLMSFSIKPTTYSPIDATKTTVPHDDAVDNFASWRNLCDGTGQSLESKISEIKAEVDDLHNKMFEATAVVHADRMNQDYATAKDILDGKFDKYLGKDKKTDKSEVCGGGTALSPLRPKVYDIKTEFDSLRNKMRASAESSDDGGDSIFQSSKTSWI